MAYFSRAALNACATINSVSRAVKEARPKACFRSISYKRLCQFLDKSKCQVSHVQRVWPEHPLGKIWYNPDCCDDPCKDAHARFDDLYYFISDKSKRKYTRTWNECPKVTRCKRVCCFDGKERSPPFKKRCKTLVVDTARPATPDCMALTGKACAKIKSPGCKALQGDVNCRKFIRPVCEKFCTPYPSFSECLRDAQKKMETNEQCPCLTKPMRCQIVTLDPPERLQRC